jgi:hypothetical protein
MYSTNSNLGQQFRHHVSGKLTGRIRISVGQSAASLMLPYVDDKPDPSVEFTKKEGKLYLDLSKQVLDGIKILGPKLFVEPTRALAGGS